MDGGSQHQSQTGNLDRDKGVKDERNGDRGMLRVQTNRTATSTETREPRTKETETEGCYGSKQTERQPRQRPGSEGRKKRRQRDATGPNKRKGVDERVGEDRSLAFRPGGLHHAVDGYSLVRNYSWEEPLLNILNYRIFLHFNSTMLNQKVHLRFTFFFLKLQVISCSKK